MTLIIIMSVMGVTCTLTYIGPFLSIPMTIPVRLNINKLVQILICMVETAETIQRQVTLSLVYNLATFFKIKLLDSARKASTIMDQSKLNDKVTHSNI